MTGLLLVLGGLHPPCQMNADSEWTVPSRNTAMEVVTDFGKYYDVNGDGKMEYLSGGALGALSTEADGSWVFRCWRVGSGGSRVLGVGPDGKIYSYDYYSGSWQTSGSCRLYRFDGKNPGIIETLVEDKNTSSVTGADFNLDGKMDFYHESSSDKTILDILPDGTVNRLPCVTMSPAEYAGVRSELKLVSGGEGIPGWEDMFGRDGAASSDIKKAGMVDVNNDGLPDIFDTTNGNYLLNTGDGRFVLSGYGAQSWLRDFDGDGINDILQLKDSKLLLYRGADPSADPVTVSDGLGVSMLWCRDVDADGDVDIVFISELTYHNPGYDAYLIVAENQGGLKFRKRERPVTFGDSSVDSGNTQLVDVDCDGNYELLYHPLEIKDGNRTSPYVCLRIDGTWEFASAEPAVLLDSSLYSVAGTLTKTGVSEGWNIFAKKNSGTYSMVKAKEFKAGSRPEKPAAPSLSYDPSTGRLSVSWERGSDAETPSADLTYELRIGTTPGGDDIARAHALSDGRRLNLAPGMCGYSTKMVYNTASWPEGKVYISVQTIDDTFLGSPFSEPAAFEKDCPASDFNYSVDRTFSVNQTLRVTPSARPSAGTTCIWDFGTDAVVVSEDAATQAREVRYTSWGDKEITLTVENSNGKRSSTTKKVRVEPVYFSDGGGGPWTLDLDGDGAHEAIKNSVLFAENGEGKYEQINKSWNSGVGDLFADVNGDGLVDILGGRTRLVNLGDGDMEKVTVENVPEWSVYDFNNDGKLDVSYNQLNSGDYMTATETGVVTSPAPHTVAWYSSAPRFYRDFNGDGLIDMGYIAGKENPDNFWVPTKLPFHIFENVDGVNFRLKEVRESVVNSPDEIDDLDGDGTLDYVFCDASYNFGISSYAEFVVVEWGDGSGITKYQCPDALPFDGVKGICDFNNDGMKDLLVKVNGENGNNGYVMTLMPDRTTCTYTGVRNFDVYCNAIKKRDGSYSFGNLLSTAPNERPLPPTDLRFVQTDKAVVVEWNPGSDKETPARGLRYNISLKKKGATGDGAYLISPLNGGDDNTLLPAPRFLNTATRLTIPVASIPAGEYEVSIQSVDHYNEGSRFSETLTFSVRESASISLPTSVMVGSPVTVTLFTNTPDVEVDFGADAVVEDLDKSRKRVTWTSEGARDIRIGGEVAASTFVHPAIDASFTLPSRVVCGASVATGTARTPGEQWQISADGVEFRAPDAYAAVEFTENGGTALRFAKAGTYTVRHKVTREYGEAVSDMVTEVYDADVAMVFVEAGDDHYVLHLDPTAAPEGAVAVKIYRETSSFDKYLAIGETAPDATAFEDVDSDPAVRTARYRVSYVMPYGETLLSEAHQPLHVQANRALNGGVNLMWNSYQGRVVDTYRVMKGDSPESMEAFAEMSGHLTSFTDTSEDAAASWYGIVAVPSADAPASRRRNSQAQTSGFRSNTVSGTDAREVRLAESVVVTAGGGVLFDGAKTKQMSARMLPVTASLNRVTWEITDGADIMDIDAMGVVTPSGFGKATVRATAQDGSGAYGEMEIENNFIPITFIDFDTKVHPENFTLESGGTFQYVLGEVTPANATESPYWECTDTSVATVDQNGLVTALKAGRTDIKVSSPSNPEVYALMSLTVVHPAGYVEATGIDIVPEYIEGVVGDRIQLTAVVKPENATDKSVTWSVVDYAYDDEEVIVGEITQDGLLTLTAPGLNWIQATSNENPYLSTVIICRVHAQRAVTDIRVSPDDLRGEPGTEIQLTAVVEPENATDKSVTWSMVGDNGVATVSETGLLRILSEGSATLEVRSVSNPSVFVYVPVLGTSGIDAVLGEEGRADVYDTHGLLLLKDASADDVRALSPGFYIINGKTVCLTGK